HDTTALVGFGTHTAQKRLACAVCPARRTAKEVSRLAASLGLMPRISRAAAVDPSPGSTNCQVISMSPIPDFETAKLRRGVQACPQPDRTRDDSELLQTTQ